MERKRIAVIAGTIIGTLSLASAAGAANFGLLRSSSDDPAPAVGNLDAGTVADGSSTSSSTITVADGSTSTSVSLPDAVPVDTSAVTSAGTSTVTTIDDDGGRRGGDDDGATPSTTPITAPGSRVTVGGTFQPPAVTTDDRSGSNSGSDDNSGHGSDDSGSDNSGSGSSGSGSGHGGGDDD